MAHRVNDAGENVTASEIEEHGSQESKKSGLSLRAVIISLLFVTVISFATSISKVYRTIPTPDAHYMRPNPIALGTVVLVVAFNMLLRKIRGRYAFSSSELITIYGMTFVGGMVVQSGYFLYWVFTIAVDAREYYLMMKSDFGKWVERLSPLVGIKDPDVATAFWFGGESVQWAYWIGPILMWALFLGVLYFVMLCMFTLVRKHWNDYEHLQYPVAQAVLLVAAPEETSATHRSGVSIWRNSLLWIGFGIAFLLASLTALNSHYPFIPALPINIFTFHELFTNEPWYTAFSVFPPVFFRMRPVLVGIGYLISAEITFSIWFFYVLSRFVVLPIQASLGVLATGNDQYLLHDIQGMGAFVALAGLSLWVARNNIKSIVASAFRGGRDDSDEILSPRVAVFGGILGFIFLVIFANVFLFASIPIAVLWFVYFYVTTFGLGRIRAQAGLPMQSATREPILVLLGSSNMSEGSVYFLGKMEPLGGEGFFPSIAQDTVDQYKMAEQVGMKRRSMTWALMVAVVFGAIASMVIGLPMLYDRGAFTFEGHFASHMHRHTNWIWVWAERFSEPSLRSVGYFLVGAVGTLVIGVLHSNFMWWPLHPIGFAISPFMRMHDIWSSFLIAWVIKTLIMRWGGPALDRKVTPIFVGLIIGTALGEMFWLLADLVVFT